MRYINATIATIILMGGFYAGWGTNGFIQKSKDTKTFHAKSIELGCGQYNSKTGEFEYVRAPEIVDMMQLAPLPTHPTPVKKGGAK